MIDHRKLGRELELFVSDPLIGAGLPIWLPAGAAARHAVEDLPARAGAPGRLPACLLAAAGQPRAVRAVRPLGHFADDMFPPMRIPATTSSCCGPACARTTRWSSAPAAGPTGNCRCGSPSWAACTGPNAPACSAG